MLAVILACAGLAVLVGGTDRLLASAIGRELARRAERMLGAGSAPVVRIASAPFLTQLVAGIYREVKVTARTCTIGSLEVHGLTVRLSQVRASVRRLLTASGHIASQVTARGLVGFVIALPGLPPELVIHALQVTDAGLEVTVTGDDVILARAEPDQRRIRLPWCGGSRRRREA